MQDNHKDMSVFALGCEPLARAHNVATNGRWGMAGMAAISLYIDRPLMAFSFVLIVLASHLAEALMPPRLLPLAYAVLAVWGAVAVACLAVLLSWR